MIDIRDREEFEKWAEDYLMHGGDKWAAYRGWNARQPEIDALKAEVERLQNGITYLSKAFDRTRPPAQEDEPVLWFEAQESTRGKDIRHVIGSMLYSTRLIVTKPVTSNPVWPLYTRPANDGLRKAAEKALYWLAYMNANSRESHTQVERSFQAENNLRAELNKVK